MLCLKNKSCRLIHQNAGEKLRCFWRYRAALSGKVQKLKPRKTKPKLKPDRVRNKPETYEDVLLAMSSLSDWTASTGSVPHVKLNKQKESEFAMWDKKRSKNNRTPSLLVK